MAENETTRDDDGLERRMAAITPEAIGVAEDVWTEDEPTLAEYELTQRILIIAARLAAPDHRADNELRTRVQALAANNCSGCFEVDHPCGDPVCALRSDLRALLDETKP
jgi:hypothetical protein